MCIICLQLDKLSFSEAWNQLEQIPVGFDHRKDVEKLIKERFKGDKEIIRIETLRDLANKYRIKKGK